MKHEILHIAVHLGGGVGSVVMNWINTDTINNHTVLCLNENYYYKEKFPEDTVKEKMRGRTGEILNHISNSDVVVVHFWNHPMLYELLVNTYLPPCRLVMWSHVSGLSAPYVFPHKLIEMSDCFIFSSPISYKAKEIESLPAKQRRKLSHIWTTGDINNYSEIEPLKHDGFNIGFIGTLDYSKLHPNFIDFCSRINIPDVKFIMCGTGCDEELIRRQVKDRGMGDKFIFTGIIEDIKPYLAIIDVFGYPLNPNHFGTCEQVLGEAIAAGVIPVVMKNPAEEYILYQSIVKFVCSTEEDYINNIELLYRDRKERAKLISYIQKHVVGLYDTEKMVMSWNLVFSDMISNVKKTKKEWPKPNPDQVYLGHKIFIESLGEYGKILEGGSHKIIRALFGENRQWRSRSKGSVIQYSECFPQDATLKEWAKLI